jgi:cleavage stimulation factor subunit 3
LTDLLRQSTHPLIHPPHPPQAQHWTRYAEWALSQSKTDLAQSIFKRSLRSLPDVALWRTYLKFIRSLASTDPTAKREALNKAYEAAIASVGWDRDSGGIWLEFIQSTKDAEVCTRSVRYPIPPASYSPVNPPLQTETTWDESRKMDAVRALYRRAITVPTVMIENIWREYDAFENNLSRLTVCWYLFSPLSKQPPLTHASTILYHRPKSSSPLNPPST